MEIKTFDFAPGARFQKGADTKDPNVIGHHIEAIRQAKGGQLTPDDVLADARNPNSPLHTFFEWDDSAAAHEHRLKQARQLIRTVVVIYKEAPDREPTRAYVNVRPAPAGDSSPSPRADQDDARPYYTEVSEALASPSTRRAVLVRAKAELDAWRRRYQDLRELAAIIDSIGQLSSEMDSILEAEEQQIAS